jgi:hypothetical protein
LEEDQEEEMMDPLIEHLTWLDNMLVIEHASWPHGCLPTRVHKAAARRLRLNGQLHPTYDDRVAKTAEEFLRTGTSAEAEKKKADSPVLADALTMCVVEGVGPRRALILLREGYKNFDALVAAAKAGKFDKRGKLASAVRKAARSKR